MRIDTKRRRLLKRCKICSDCGIVIDNERIKSMRCIQCGVIICYKCNNCYKCKNCYVEGRNDYYVDESIKNNNNVII